MKSVSLFMFALCMIFPMNVSGQWLEYIATLTNSGNIKDATIMGLNGVTWASSPGFSLKAGEGENLVSLFKTPHMIFASGVTLAGVKYLGTKGDERSIYGKRGSGGVVCVKTNQSVIIGTYIENMKPGNAANQVEGLADYLIEYGV